MKKIFKLALAVASLTAWLMPAWSADSCKIAKYFDLSVTMRSLQPLVDATIEDKPVKFIADSGAFFSFISAGSAAELGLRLEPLAFGYRVSGNGGTVFPSRAVIKNLGLAGITLHDIPFMVGGNDMGGQVIGLLGQNFLRLGDTEYDLANGVIRLFRVNGCKEARLAYWTRPGDAYSVMDIESTSSQKSLTQGKAFVNGQSIHVTFDTGASTSFLSTRAAARAGVKLDSPGTTDSGYSFGIGRGAVKTFVAPFDSFKIGDEEIKHTRLRVGDLGDLNTDMLLGADFFLSHRVFVARSQRKLYFTYNGGPVFNLAAHVEAPISADAGSAAATPNSSASVPASEPAPAPVAALSAPVQAASVDAEGLSRRAMALASRRDFTAALADLDQACALDPMHAEYYFLRGTVRLSAKQMELAGKDFDRVLELQPDHVPALVQRAQWRVMSNDFSGARVDLDAVDKIAAKQADVRFTLADVYARAAFLPEAIVQLDQWIAFHPENAGLAAALNSRCWARALIGDGLPQALKDCNRALKLVSKESVATAAVLDSRGMVRLRLGDLDKSVEDFDSALKLRPTLAWSLYGRGIAKQRQGKMSEGNADLEAARKIDPGIDARFKQHGIEPIAASPG